MRIVDVQLRNPPFRQAPRIFRLTLWTGFTGYESRPILHFLLLLLLLPSFPLIYLRRVPEFASNHSSFSRKTYDFASRVLPRRIKEERRVIFIFEDESNEFFLFFFLFPSNRRNRRRFAKLRRLKFVIRQIPHQNSSCVCFFFFLSFSFPSKREEKKILLALFNRHGMICIREILHAILDRGGKQIVENGQIKRRVRFNYASLPLTYRIALNKLNQKRGNTRCSYAIKILRRNI